MALNPVAAGVPREEVSITTFFEGTRDRGGQRYVSVVSPVRNVTGGPLANLTVISP